jgi:hypothetical protein
MNPDEQARELINAETAAGDMPDRQIGPVTLDVPSFPRRRLLGRVMERMSAAGATEMELLFAYVAGLGMPIGDVRTAARTTETWEEAMDAWFESAFGGMPSGEQILAARKLFDDDLSRITAASFEIEPKPGSVDKDAPPNSSGQSPS